MISTPWKFRRPVGWGGMCLSAVPVPRHPPRPFYVRAGHFGRVTGTIHDEAGAGPRRGPESRERIELPPLAEPLRVANPVAPPLASPGAGVERTGSPARLCRES